MVMAQEWALDLTPIENADWTPARAAHLLERAGFGGHSRGDRSSRCDDSGKGSGLWGAI